MNLSSEGGGGLAPDVVPDVAEVAEPEVLVVGRDVVDVVVEPPTVASEAEIGVDDLAVELENIMNEASNM